MKVASILKHVIILLLYFVFFCNCSNFHEVTPDNLYRSAQLSSNNLDHYIKKYGIKTVINLRGASPGSKWYDNEINIARKDNLYHIDIPLSATHYVSPEKLDSIMNVVIKLPRPLLVHCRGGADRSGLFCASWRLKVEKYSVEKASNQLSFIYGHVPFFIWGKTKAMDSSYNDYVRYLNNIR